ncbi:hypothetical protein [Clostridium sp.]|uniref:hypothetical protein n=1 Tax=Clostridium sp. TaxID=1506 RepID=UPI0025C72B8C|nr:hypothetical protein [Clostridium sp.]
MYKVTKTVNGVKTIDIDLDNDKATNLFNYLKDDVNFFFRNNYDSFDTMSEYKNMYRNEEWGWDYEKYIVYNGDCRVDLLLTNLSTSSEQ